MTDTTLAFVDFLRDNPDAMRQIENTELGIKLLNALAQRSPISSLVPMTQNSLTGDKLLLHLNSLATQKPDRKEFHRAVVAFSEEFVLESFWEIETVAEVLAEADLVDLIEHCPQLLDANHPLHGKLHANPYWERRIHHYLVRGDYRRTWDEIGKARRGFPEHKQESADSIDRRFCRKQEVGEVVFRGEEGSACSKVTLVKLIGELFSAMLEKGLVTPVTEADTMVDDKFIKMEVFESAPTKGGRKIRSYEQTTQPAGWSFACLFRIREKGWDRTQTKHSRYDIFDETGAQILKIATYFRGKKSEQRRKRHEEALRNFEKK